MSNVIIFLFCMKTVSGEISCCVAGLSMHGASVRVWLKRAGIADGGEIEFRPPGTTA
jgi:hypothetical protein